jgi:hypothetical protein
MTFDPVFVTFIKSVAIPLAGVALFLIQIGSYQRVMNKLVFGMIAKLVKKGTFDATDLLDLGVLEAAQQTTFTGSDLLKMISGAMK